MSTDTSSAGRPSPIAAVALAGAVGSLTLFATQPLSPVLARTYHASTFAVGLTITVPTVAVAVCAPLAGRLADAVGLRRVLLWSAALLSLITALAATSTSLASLMLWRLLQGVVTPGVFASTSAYIHELWPSARTGRATAAYVSGSVIGGFLGRATVGLVGAWTDWHLAFVVLGGLNAAMVLVLWRLLPDERAHRHGDAPPSAAAGGIAALLANRTLVSALVVGFCVFFAQIAIFTYVTFHAAAPPYNFGPAALAWLFAVYLIGAGVTPLAGYVVDHHGHRLALTLSMAFCAVGALTTLAPSVVAIVVGLAGCASGAFMGHAVTNSFIGTVATRDRALAMGLYSACYYAGGGVGAALPGLWWSRAGWTGCVVLVLGVAAMATAVARSQWNASRDTHDLVVPETGVSSDRSPSPAERLPLAAVVLAGAAAFLDLYATQPLLPFLARTFQASAFAVGLTITVPTLAVAVCAPLAGRLADRVGLRRVIVIAAALLSVVTALAATSRSLTWLIVWRLAQGVLTPGVFACTVAYIHEVWPPARVGRATAAYVSGTVVGGFIGRATTGVVAADLNWHAAFLALATLNAAVALALWRILPDERRHSTRRRAVDAGSWAHLLRNRQLLAAFGVGFCVLFTQVALFTYVTFYAAGPPFHLSTVALGWLFAVYLVGAGITPIAGHVVDRYGHRVAIGGAMLISAAGALLTLVPSMAGLIGGLALCATGVFTSQATTSSFIGAVTRRDRALAVGLYSACYYAGGSAGAALPALVWSRWGWGACIALVVAVQATGATVALTQWSRASTPHDLLMPEGGV